MLMNAISPLNGGQLESYYNDRAYPLDLNGSQDYTRPQSGVSPFPFPVMLSNYIRGFVPMFDAFELNGMRAKSPYGPFIGSVPESLNAIFPDITGGIAKVGG